MSEAHKTPAEAAVVHESGRVRVTPELEVLVIPAIDTRYMTETHDPMFARLDGPNLREFARKVGARVPTGPQFEAISKASRALGCELKPCKLPTKDMIRAFQNVNGACPPESRPKDRQAWLTRLYAPMASFDWCQKHDAAVWKQLRVLLASGLKGPFANIGKPEIRRATEAVGAIPSDMLLAGWWEDGKWIQAPNENPDHGNYHTDYSKVVVVVWETSAKVIVDCGKSEPEPKTEPKTEPATTPAREPWDDDGLFVPAARTPATVKMVYDALRAAWPRIIQKGEPNDAAMRILVAQSAIETGNWHSLWNWNLGNVKRIRGQRWTMLNGVWEIINGKRVVFQPPHVQTHFSAYASLEAAAPAWLGKMQAKWGKAWAHALAGDTVGFSKALKKADYYSQLEEIYTRELVARVAGLDDEMFDVPAALAKLGYSDVRAFQKAHPPLAADGIAGPKTKAALRAELSKAA